MATLPTSQLTPEQYLEIERQATTKSEYFKGEMFAMSGVSRVHVKIVSNILVTLSNQLKDRNADCDVFASDLRVAVAPSGLYTYPDVIVTCGPGRFLDKQFDTLLDPLVLIEVLSPSTRDYDIGRKFAQYRQIASLREYLTVEQTEAHLVHWSRDDENRWTVVSLQGTEDGAEVNLPSIQARLKLGEVYDRVSF